MSYSRAQIAKVQLAAIGFMFFWSMYGLAGDVKVIANRSIKADSISASELRKVFLAEQNTLKNGSHVEPVFERGGTTHETFLREFLRENAGSLQSHYGALVFTGKALMPKSFNSDAEVLIYVARTRGAIGYVDASASSEGVKVLDVISEGGRPSRALLTRVEPEYPETLRQARIGGTVRLQITISPQGKVETVDLLGGNPILGESAMKAVHQWVYVAAPSRTKLLVTLAFGAQ
jgi:TonB family protein